MKCEADIHYEIIRKPSKTGDIMTLACKFCSYCVTRYEVGQPRTSTSGLGRYNRMRARMVKHLHAEHRDRLNEAK